MSELAKKTIHELAPLIERREVSPVEVTREMIERIQAVDDAARRAFARYWRVVGPFSGVIRRRWLKHIAAG